MQKKDIYTICFSIVFFIQIASTGSAFAQMIQKIDVGKFKAGKEAEIILRGTGLKNVTSVDTVRFDEINLKVLYYEIFSDEKIIVKFRIPKSAVEGKHKISVLASNSSSKIWLSSGSNRIAEQYFPQIEVSFDGKPVKHDPSNAMQFEPTAVNNASVQKLLIKNTGKAELTLSNLKLPPGFSLIQPMSENILPGKNDLLIIQFKTDSAVTVSDIIQFETNVNNQKLFKIPVQATSLSNPDYDIKYLYGIQNRNITEPERENIKSFLIKNTGTKKIVVNNFQIPENIMLQQPVTEYIDSGDSAFYSLKLNSATDYTAQHKIQFDLVCPEIIPVNLIMPTSINLSHINQTEILFGVEENPYRKYLKDANKLTDKEFSYKLINIGKEVIEIEDYEMPAGFQLTTKIPEKIESTESADFVFTADSEIMEKNEFKINVADSRIIEQRTQNILAENRVNIEIVKVDSLIKLNTDDIIHIGNTIIGESITRSLKITNNKKYVVTLDSIILPLGFSINNGLPARLEIGSSTVITIQLNADSAMASEGSLIIMDKQQNEKLVDIKVSGTVFSERIPEAASDDISWFWPVVFGILLIASTIAAGLIIFGNSAVFEKFGLKIGPEIRFVPHIDLGIHNINQKKSILPGIHVSVKPVLDFGKQQILSDKQLILYDNIRSEQEKPDDLTIIEGIGPKISSILDNRGIKTFKTLSETSSSELNSILREESLWIAEPDTWPEQARLAANSEWESLQALQKELKAGRRVES